jgi:hypothetical protein
MGRPYIFRALADNEITKAVGRLPTAFVWLLLFSGMGVISGGRRP